MESFFSHPRSTFNYANLKSSLKLARRAQKKSVEKLSFRNLLGEKMNAPTHLKHRPILEVADYDEIDAQYAKDTDVVALSIGNAQYDGSEISLKVWRHTGERFSRQSEEMPVHRGVDIVLLLVGALLHEPDANRSITSLRETQVDGRSVQEIKDYYDENKKFLEPRLKELRDRLNDLLPQKKI